MSGSVPSNWWGGFPKLSQFDVRNNGLTGTVAFDIIASTMKSLRYLNLQDNQFAGIINTQLGLMTNLWYCQLYNNQFVGQFPSEFSKLSELRELILTDLPNIQGQIPSEIAQLPIRELKFSQSNLSGSLPTEIFLMTTLQALELSDLPLASSESSSLRKFIFGTIPTTIGQLTDLYDLRLQNMGISGSIPSELGLLSGLSTLRLQGNNLEGSVPGELCSLRGVTGMTEFIADCAVSSTNPDAPIVSCPDQCCTTCCRAGESKTCGNED